MRPARRPILRRETIWTSFPVVLLLLGTLAALWVFAGRWHEEAGYRTVEVIVDERSVRELAHRVGFAEPELLAYLRGAGATTLAVSERTLDELVLAGEIALVRPHELQAFAAPWTEGVPREVLGTQDTSSGRRPDELSVLLYWQGSRLSVPSEELAARLAQVGGVPVSRSDSEYWWKLPGEVELSAIGVGYDPLVLRHASDLGFHLALRPLDSPAWLPGDVGEKLLDIVAVSDRRPLIIFDGTKVPGAPLSLEAWAEALERQNLPVAWIEFTTQLGLSHLIREHGYQAVRLHSISAAELERLTPEQAVARWRRAVLERNVRALYVRFYTEVPAVVSVADSVDLLDFNLQYLRRMTQGLSEVGYSPGRATPLALRPVGRVRLVLLFLSVTAAGILLLRRFVRLGGPLEALLIVGLTLLLSLFPLGHQGAAFGAAVIFPTVGTLWLLRTVRSVKGKRSSRLVLSGFCVASGISLLGALHVVGLLSEMPFAIGIDLFLGVKAMHLLPPLLVALGVLWGEPVQSLREIPAKLLNLLRRPVPLGFIASVALLGALAAIMLLRTGNHLLPVSTAEQWLRTTLEESLPVRPRNKEFLLGHPVLILTAVLAHRRKLGEISIAAGAALGSIGQLSMVNTFAHIHAPLATSLIRTLLGLVLGAAIGLLGVQVLRGLTALRHRAGAK